MHVVDNSSSRGVMTKWCGILEVTCTRIAGSSERYAGDSWYYCLSTHTKSARCRHCCRLTMSHSLIRRAITWHSNRIWSPSSDFSVQPCVYVAHLGTYWFQGHIYNLPYHSFHSALTAEARFQSQANACGFYGGQRGSRIGFSAIIAALPCQLSIHQCSYRYYIHTLSVLCNFSKSVNEEGISVCGSLVVS